MSLLKRQNKNLIRQQIKGTLVELEVDINADDGLVVLVSDNTVTSVGAGGRERGDGRAGNSDSSAEGTRQGALDNIADIVGLRVDSHTEVNNRQLNSHVLCVDTTA
eukprot:TRINITY_DN2116_c0_g1_i3.p1 TRINITY_DN2116_c0_g1~~TRINITY_DN2116_c0_g1_i3.p1  ORF type:complete len:106 (+),score=8.74 TRINITY_DN2116_c0_g1_i3:44-361(+)